MSAAPADGTVTDLPVAYADTRAAQLGFSLTAPAQPALAESAGTVGEIAIALRLLGASHQVIVDDGRRRICETLACLPGETGDRPASLEQSGYRFTSRIDVHSPVSMADLVGDVARTVVERRAAGLPALLGRFPGEPNAVTAIAVAPADDHRVSWQTWHTYPQSGEVVVTTSTLDHESVTATAEGLIR
ncbi:DUF2617 family protein [Gordonia sp. ABSL1-1]|uniref:DUF2617 family protein n=1 Tax=Gordonia sp. ABSL1-1 TaxID=3053923 RepID=UPI002572A99E|nr:DUF2617 family protein [Gordonia sp. ABSL1-1]MDL9936962.1 DUF2617 family protein [Gordonia sp. ABSL1-1]